jgi:UbiA prenyltransferase family
MMNVSLRKTLDFISNSNLFVSCCAFFFSKQALLSLNITDKRTLSLYPLLVSVSVFFIYGCQRLYHSKRSRPPFTEREQWYAEHFGLILFPVAFSGLAVVSMLFFFPPVMILYFLPLLAVSLLYYLGPLPLRKIHMLKGFLIALVWTAVCVAVPYCLFPNQKTAGEMYFLTAGTFFLVSGLCIPFDIRDMKEDREKNILSLPVLYGITGSKVIAVLMVVAFPLLLRFWGKTDRQIVYAGFTTALISAAVILLSGKKRSGNFLLLRWMECCCCST